MFSSYTLHLRLQLRSGWAAAAMVVAGSTMEIVKETGTRMDMVAIGHKIPKAEMGMVAMAMVGTAAMATLRTSGTL